jgi:hypothetical protein
MVTSFLKSMIWVILLLIVAGLLLHLMVQYGILGNVAKWVGQQTNLSAQAGG